MPAFSDFSSIDRLKYADEESLVQTLLEHSPLRGFIRTQALTDAQMIVRKARERAKPVGMLETFLDEFGLTTPEGLALMCLAEALLRVPDQETADKLIAEKIASGDWGARAGKSDSALVNASVWGLMLTGKVVDIGPEARQDLAGFMHRLTRKAGEPVIRAAVGQAMVIMGEQFVLGRTIEAAIKRGKGAIRKQNASHFSFDMLGEGARTQADARRYALAYAQAIEAVGQSSHGLGPKEASGISVKLSALYPRYEARQAQAVHRDLFPIVLDLAIKAKSHDIGFCLDAEEADRLVLSLELLDRLAHAPQLAGWNGLGLAVQAYQKRATETIASVISIARSAQRQMMVRLVKGAYWDAEIKRAQVAGRPDFPVFTTKSATDVSYLSCAELMLRAGDAVYGQFATHNAHTLAAVRALAQAAGQSDYEFQRLHGMGETLYATARDLFGEVVVRVYAPVGAHEDLLPYLVRRLLENGANTSFVHAFLDEDVPVEKVAADPMTSLEAGARRHAKLPAPPALYGASRANSRGLDLSTASDVDMVNAALKSLNQALLGSGDTMVTSPQDHGKLVGKITLSTHSQVTEACTSAAKAYRAWDARGGQARSLILMDAANRLEADMGRLIALCCQEAGKTLQDGIDEVREAVDFLRYYGAQAAGEFQTPLELPSPAGESNCLSLHGRGVFACISPWNFPLAIFIGQVAAALAAGNGVVAKPAEQTPLIAGLACEHLFAAGVPRDVLHLVLGDGAIGAHLVADPLIAGVAFTGSSQVARQITLSLAQKQGPIVPLIAETGGLNAMFVDTTALKEQVVDDVMVSAFGSAGQRCSALRLLFLPYETADDIIACLIGAMDELIIGDPALVTTDIGPIIDGPARQALEAHQEKMQRNARIHKKIDVGNLADTGHYFGPCLIEIDHLDQLEGEVFGPILHIVRYHPEAINDIGAALASKGYGLTLGCHTRLDSFIDEVQAAVPAGNYYVNRSMIGAVVGVQPFGGEGLSGTGPKAGGPHYLHRFATERTKTVNLAAQGGDPRLFNL
ncbi:bifunctional proline dehydrogenase/L-glutamate gamma-semialdehyde dehydrogenase PutA [Candidatus Phycosocius spiralis]|uniref:Bifunctional protein PutA n=1 Tax=Candidatus Phycosocius spiralis TaxID=2815099 RepID=A0ABQ4PZN6_9PROT|nr:bifunctional proline dehydrogenase/L-glutamate gamma-semialdehyde dehydrogenase PutA [Candidatus Phycosocius spiralis]GIU68124.1 bifunctional protein PutA [Candidatus Phycosocius spiralis]